MIHEIRPHEGVGPINLGMTRDEVRTVLGAPTYSDPSKDFFCDSSLHAHYSSIGILELIVVAPGPFEATFLGVNLLKVDAENAVATVNAAAQLDTTDCEYPLSCTYPSLDLNLWRSCSPEDDPEAGSRFEAIGIGTIGYFSRRRPS